MSKQKAYILIGLPGSGKSTWTEKKMNESNPRGIGVVSRDSIRHMVNGNYKYIEAQQDLVTDIAAEAAKVILREGHDLVVDQMNLTRDIRKEVVTFIKKVVDDYRDLDEFEIHFICMKEKDVDLLVKRRMKGDSRGEKEGYHCNVIKKMKNSFESPVCQEDYDILEYIDKDGEVFCRYNGIPNPKEEEPKEEIPREELWNLNYTFAEYIYPRLKAFREGVCGYPGSLDYKNGKPRIRSKSKGYNNLTEKLWHEILDKMVLAFELWLSSDDWDCEINSKEYDKRWAKVNEGFSLFMKHFNGLWW